MAYQPFEESLSSATAPRAAPRVARVGRILEVVGDGSYAACYMQLFCYPGLSLKKEKGGMLNVDALAFDKIDVGEELLPLDDPLDTLSLSALKHEFDETHQHHSFYFYD